MQAQIAFAGNRHAKRSVGEHLDFNAPSGRTADIVSVDDCLDLLYLGESQFPCQHNHIGKLGIEPQGFCI